MPRISVTSELRHGSGSGETSPTPGNNFPYTCVCRCLCKQRLNILDWMCVCKPGLLLNVITSSWSFSGFSLPRPRGERRERVLQASLAWRSEAPEAAAVRAGCSDCSTARLLALASPARRCPTTPGSLGLPGVGPSHPHLPLTSPWGQLLQPTPAKPFPATALIFFLSHFPPLNEKDLTTKNVSFSLLHM